MNLRRLFPLLLVALGLLAISPRNGFAEDDRSGYAAGAAQNWLNMIDSGKYGDSYQAGCDALHEKVPKDRWILVLSTLRDSWGPVINRKLVNQVIKPDGVYGLTGQCVVLTYNTSFKRLDNGAEEVVLKLEGGRWFGAGYQGGPKQRPPGSPAPEPTSQTEMQTQTIKAPPQRH